MWLTKIGHIAVRIITNIEGGRALFRHFLIKNRWLKIVFMLYTLLFVSMIAIDFNTLQELYALVPIFCVGFIFPSDFFRP